MGRASTAAIIVAGGSGERFGRPAGKQLVEVAGKPLVSWSLLAFDEADEVGHIVVVCPGERADEFGCDAVGPLELKTPISFAPSGESRQASVASGLSMVPEAFGIIAVHDGARALIDSRLIARLIERLVQQGADGVVVGYPSVDTLKRVSGDRVIDTPERESLWAVQTPQVFRRGALERAHATAAAEHFLGTDDASLVERDGGTVIVEEGPRTNLKLTVPDDLVFIEAALRAREGGCGS